MQELEKGFDPNDEELVYVRLETLGSSIRDLSTLAINERLLVGVFKRLLGENEAELERERKEQQQLNAATSKTPSRQQMVINDIRAQISSEGTSGSSNSNGLNGNAAPAPPPPPPHSSSFSSSSSSTLLLLSEENSKLADKCRLSIEKFLCRMVYPVCHFRRTDVSALVRPPCREDCLLLRDILCSNLDWSQFITVLRGAFNETLSSFINSLDLDVQGDLDSRLEPSSSSLSSSSSSSSKEPSSTSKQPLKQITPDNDNSSDHQFEPPTPPLPAPASSVHLYWPHEHSLGKCELLPSLKLVQLPTRSIVRHHNHHRHYYQQQSQPPSLDNTTLSLYKQQPHQSDLASSTMASTDNGGFHKNVKRRKRRQSRLLMQEREQHHNLKWPVCSNAHLTNFNSELTTKSTSDSSSLNPECLTSSSQNDGSNYQGHENKTRSGLACQPWTSQEPHKHKSTELLFDNMDGAANFCRNPGGVELRPWCYTTDPKTRWEFCDIPQCVTNH